MIKHKLYILISVLIISLIFTTSAICNQCSVPITIESSEESNTESISVEKEEKQEEAETSAKEGVINNPPEIISLKISDGTIFCGSIVDAFVEATDVDSDSLSYSWEIGNGTIDNVNSPHTLWTAPDSPGGTKIVVTVTDGKGGGVEAAIDVPIVEYSGGYEE